MVPDHAQVFLALMCAIFSYLGVTILLDPDDALKGHGLSFTGAEAAALAEVRAFYSGCFGTLAYVCGRCVPAGQTTERRRDALNAVGCLLALFSLARVYSYAVDGPPGRGNVYALWALEALGATAALCLSLVESICSSAVDGVAAAGAVLLGGRKGE